MKKSDVTIQELGPRGDGIAKDARGRIYVDRSVPGDQLEIKIKDGPDNTRRGEIMRMIKPSENRQKPPCEYYDVCGGCTLQHVKDKFYRDWKIHVVREAFERQDVNVEKYKDPIFIPEGHRRRVTFTALKQRNGAVLGYNKRRSKFINDIDTCLIADPDIMTLREVLKQYLAPVLKEGRPIDVFIQKVNDTFDVVLTGQLGHKGKLDLSILEMAGSLVQNTKIVRVGWRLRPYDAVDVIVEKEPFRITFGPLNIHLPAASFLQPTREGEQVLVNAVMDALPKEGRFADLFSGCGTFAGKMVEGGIVDAYESNQAAMAALDKAAQSVNAKLTTCIRDLFRDPLSKNEANNYDAIVFDPPRAGAKEQVMQLALSRVKTLIGVSCNPATFARDAKILTQGGYGLESIQIVDQFTWSHHVELVGLFTKK